MNLVQINERLKEMPMQAVQQYANGSNPMIPPYLALGELQRREKLKQQMSMDQGAAQGPQPSVKEQIEQKAGLMGLQQAMMRQAQQQQPMPSGMPTPEGTPEPREQPQEMAHGGVAGIPMSRNMYNFCGGGIIAFSDGGQAKEIGSDKGWRYFSDGTAISPDGKYYKNGEMVYDTAKTAAPATTGERSPLMQQAVASATEVPEKPTAENVISGINALLPQELQDAARQKRAEEAKARAEEAQKQFQSSRPSGLDQMIKTFGQAGQYKGLSGLAPAYTQNREQLAAQEAAFRKEQEATRAKEEERNLAEAQSLFGARSKEMTAQSEGYRKQLASRTEALASLAGTDQRAIDAALNRMSDKELTEMRIAADKANAMRPGEGERVMAKILALRAAGKNDEADNYIATWSQIKGGGTAAVGGERNEISRKRLQINSWKDIRDNAESDEERKEAGRNILRITKEIAKLEEGGGGGGLTMSMEDVRATAKASGKSEADVIAAAKARGYTIK